MLVHSRPSVRNKKERKLRGREANNHIFAFSSPPPPPVKASGRKAPAVIIMGCVHSSQPRTPGSPDSRTMLARPKVRSNNFTFSILFSRTMVGTPLARGFFFFCFDSFLRFFSRAVNLHLPFHPSPFHLPPASSGVHTPNVTHHRCACSASFPRGTTAAAIDSRGNPSR